MAVEYGIVTSVVPPGGWHYLQKLASGGQAHKIIGFSFEQLLENILDFRRRHLELCGAENANIEAVRADVKAYYCAHFRQNCADSHPAPQTARGLGISRRDQARPIDRAGNWLAQIASTRPEFIDSGLATHRAQICAACQMNIRWATPCAPCNETVQVRLQNFLGNLRTPLDSHLHMCRIYGHVNAAAVWLANPQSNALFPPPAHCWVPSNGQ